MTNLAPVNPVWMHSRLACLDSTHLVTGERPYFFVSLPGDFLLGVENFRLGYGYLCSRQKQIYFLSPEGFQILGGPNPDIIISMHC